MFKQWKNSEEVIDWFETINNKKWKIFCELCHEELLPNLIKTQIDTQKTQQRKHLIGVIYFSNSISKFTKFEIDTIMQTCKSFMLHDNIMWKKTKSNDNFDVPLSSFHSA